MKCDDHNEKEEEEEKALDSFSEEEEEVEKKKGDDDEKKKKKRKGVEKEEDGDEHKREEITPYNALDSGSLLFEDMWNVRSRAMEEYAPAENYIKQTRCRQHFVSFEDYFGGADGYREGTPEED